MKNFRTSSLFHYSDLTSIKKILKEGLIPNYCKEDLRLKGSGPYFGIPMVSFCDIPLSLTELFRSRYGNHAIGFKKEWAIRNNILPVQYLTDPFLKSDSSFIEHWPSKDKRFGFLKKYVGMHEEKEQSNYEENEWRYVLENSVIPWLSNEKECDDWRGTHKKKPSPTKDMINNKLKFSVKDISAIIVGKNDQIEKIVRHIKKLESFGGKPDKLTPKERKDLNSKIISIECIREIL